MRQVDIREIFLFVNHNYFFNIAYLTMLSFAILAASFHQGILDFVIHRKSLGVSLFQSDVLVHGFAQISNEMGKLTSGNKSNKDILLFIYLFVVTQD